MNRLLAWFAHNTVAANLLMLMILLAGFLAVAFGVRREMFPIVSLDIVAVRVPYPGATPVEVEEGILLRIEEAIADLEGIDTLDSLASEGLGLAIVKVRTDHDTRRLLDDVKTRVDAITTFPKDAEEPTVEELVLEMRVITIALSSETADALTLRKLAEELREDLLRLPGITQVMMGGVRPYEIGIHVSEESLRRYGLTFDDVADAVRASSLNVPAGAIRAGGGDIRVRTEGQAYHGHEFEEIVLLTNADGTRVRLADVATVVDGFEEDEQWTRFDGRQAVMLSVLATARENVPDVAARVHKYVEQMVRPTMPSEVHLDTWFDYSRYYTERQDLMLRNGLTGLVLVFLCLALFLHFRLAFWVAVGLAISFVGTFAVLWYVDVSINMISMAAFILVLGIVVDDAIVVSESIHHRQSLGEQGLAGAVSGVKRVAKPVIFAVLTSVIAFLPMFAISGVDGKFWRVIPIVIVSCLLFSLVESMLILPAHLSHEPRRKIAWYLLPVVAIWLFVRLQRIADGALQGLVRHVYRPVLEAALTWRYMTLAVFTALLILTIGLVAGGRVRAAFFPRPPGDVAVATLEMPNGINVDATRRVLERIETAAEQIRKELDGGKEVKVVKHILVAMGTHPMGDAQEPGGLQLASGGSHLAEVTMEFENLYERGVSSEAIADRWRKRVGIVPGVRRLTFDAVEGDDAKDIHIRLASNKLEDIELAAKDLKQALHGYAGVFEINDTLGTRQPEITLHMKPAAETLGLRRHDLARQVRQGFYGEEAQRVQRGRDDVRVMVRYPLDQRRSVANLKNMRVRTPSGDEVPLTEVAEIEFGLGMASIRRSERQRVVDVTAMLQREVVDNPDGIMKQLKAGVLGDLPESYPGLTWSLEGGMKDQQRVMKELGIGFVVALFAMYAMMAIAFNSYVQPLLIGAAIPFGFVGAVGGHALVGETVSMISFLGLVALAGVVVNDSLVLIDAINRSIRRGVSIHEAVRMASQTRFRAILLTSLTTFLGLTPMMMETSMQARFIVPMAVTLAFGVAFATLITLTLMPALYLMIDDAKRLLAAFSTSFAQRANHSATAAISYAEPSPTSSRNTVAKAGLRS